MVVCYLAQRGGGEGGQTFLLAHPSSQLQLQVNVGIHGEAQKIFQKTCPGTKEGAIR